MEIGDRILEYRKKNNLSQEDLALSIGVTRQTISKWELNETVPDMRQILKLVSVFGVKIDEFLGNDKNEEMGDSNDTTDSKRGMGLFPLMVNILMLFLFVIILIITAMVAYKYGKEEQVNTLSMVCILDDKAYPYSITYGPTNDIIMTDGTPMVFDNVYDRNKHNKYVDLITDVNNYFISKGGFCK